MKKLSLFVSAFALFASTSYAAVDCGTLPTCESLGYSDTVSQCPNKSIKCPFDETKGACLHEAAIGEIAYFPGRAPLGKGWLPCDGSSYPIADYPELAEFLAGAPITDTSSKYGNPFCEADVQKYHGTCSSTTFAVPDYRGYFLRVAAMWRGGNSTSLNSNFTSFGGGQRTRVASINTPQKEQLPNIKGKVAISAPGNYTGEGALFPTAGLTNGGVAPNGASYGIGLNATLTKGTGKDVYTEGGHVIPANYSVYAYIYAGKVIK